MRSSPVTYAVETYIRATPEEVWRAVTDGDMTAQYFFGSRIESTWIPGDELVYLGPDGTRMVEGTVTEVDRPRRLQFRARLLFDPEVAKDAPIRLTYEITPLGEASRLVLVHDEFQGETATYHAVGAAAPLLFASIKSLLETGKALAIPA